MTTQKEQPPVATSQERIGFVGVGRMGANMARRLKEAGFQLTSVFDIRHPAALALASELRLDAAHTPAEVA
jgi:3-hydroxyisobutyrate dehydrogenase